MVWLKPRMRLQVSASLSNTPAGSGQWEGVRAGRQEQAVLLPCAEPCLHQLCCPCEAGHPARCAQLSAAHAPNRPPAEPPSSAGAFWPSAYQVQKRPPIAGPPALAFCTGRTGRQAVQTGGQAFSALGVQTYLQPKTWLSRKWLNRNCSTAGSGQKGAQGAGRAPVRWHHI